MSTTKKKTYSWRAADAGGARPNAGSAWPVGVGSLTRLDLAGQVLVGGGRVPLGAVLATPLESAEIVDTAAAEDGRRTGDGLGVSGDK
jgi:hypothetical protein